MEDGWRADISGPTPRAHPAAEYEVARRAVHRAGLRRALGRRPYILYTGGTTGMPKGVMWRQEDIFAAMDGFGHGRRPEAGDPEDPPSG